MAQGIPSPPLGEQERKFETLINALRSVLETSRIQSDILYDKASRFHAVTLRWDQEAQQEKDPMMKTNGILTEISELINQLDGVNERNQEILQHLDGLV